MKNVKERDVERHLVNRVRELGGEIRKVGWIGRQGAPDRVVMWPSRWVNVSSAIIDARLDWVELKSSVGTLRPVQAREHAAMRRMGQRVFVLNSIHAVEEYLKATQRG